MGKKLIIVSIGALAVAQATMLYALFSLSVAAGSVALFSAFIPWPIFYVIHKTTQRLDEKELYEWYRQGYAAGLRHARIEVR